MNTALALGLLLGLIWGEAVALFIRHTAVGRALSAHLMWLVVAIGCSGIFLISLLLVQPGGLIYWWQLLALMVAGCGPIAAHSLAEGLVPTLLRLVQMAGEEADGDADQAP